MVLFWHRAILLGLAPLLVAAHPTTRAVDTTAPATCTGTIASLNDVPNAVQCTTINIESFTVPAGQTFDLALLDSTTVNLLGDIAFGNVSWAGPLFRISGNSVTFNGNGHTFDGGGPFYWDGLGDNGIKKPTPMMQIWMSGMFMDTKIVNSPVQTFGVSNYDQAGILIKGITIDNSQGDLPNDKSNGQPAGRNTDGFDVGGTGITIENSIVTNQDDCVCINFGSDITIKGNQCTGSHGISIAPDGDNVTISGILIQNNNMVNNVQALRIKTNPASTGSIVTNVNYMGNTGTGLQRFGVLIDQSYPQVLGTPGSGVIVSNVNFAGATNTLSVQSTATPVAVNCGAGACTGTWNWASLQTSAGQSNFLNNAPTISGFSI